MPDQLPLFDTGSSSPLVQGELALELELDGPACVQCGAAGNLVLTLDASGADVPVCADVRRCARRQAGGPR